MNIKTLMGLSILIILLSACEAPWSGPAASATTPTIVALPAVTATPVAPTPRPTASPLPYPSPTPSPTPLLLPALVPPTPAAVAEISTAVPGQLNEAASIGTTAQTSLSGDWDFTFGSMSLSQQAARVEGTYQWYGGADTGRVEGIVIDELNQFQGLWVSNGNPTSQSFLRWQLAADRNSFLGNFTGSRTGQWCGVRAGQPLPAGCGFSGTWQLHFGSPPNLTGQATLVQTGQTVRGTYVDSAGHSGEILDGVITAQSITEVKLSGIWRNDQGEQDTFEWRLDLTTGRTFQGRRNPGLSEWCGWREEASEPAQCGW